MTIALITLTEAAIAAAFFMAWIRRDRTHQARIDTLIETREQDRTLELATRFLAQLEHQATQHHEAQAQAHPDVQALIDLTDRLCQRIQAPAVAVGQHVDATSPAFAPPAVSMFNDEDHWDAQLSKEDLAARAYAAEMNPGLNGG